MPRGILAKRLANIPILSSSSTLMDDQLLLSSIGSSSTEGTNSITMETDRDDGVHSEDESFISAEVPASQYGGGGVGSPDSGIAGSPAAFLHPPPVSSGLPVPPRLPTSAQRPPPLIPVDYLDSASPRLRWESPTANSSSSNRALTSTALALPADIALKMASQAHWQRTMNLLARSKGSMPENTTLLSSASSLYPLAVTSLPTAASPRALNHAYSGLLQQHLLSGQQQHQIQQQHQQQHQQFAQGQGQVLHRDEVRVSHHYGADSHRLNAVRRLNFDDTDYQLFGTMEDARKRRRVADFVPPVGLLSGEHTLLAKSAASLKKKPAKPGLSKGNRNLLFV
jgi:hypothetical protein